MSYYDIEHPFVEHIPFGKINTLCGESSIKKNHLEDFNKLKNQKFTKKFVLIYPVINETSFSEPRGKTTEYDHTLEEISKNNPNNIFIIINFGNFNSKYFSKTKNIFFWEKKYYLDPHWAKKLDIKKDIKRDKKYWFSCLMGRQDYYRTDFFQFVNENNLLNNPVSYLCFGDKEHVYDPNKKTHYQNNYLSTCNKNKKYSEMIPYNNFEDEIPVEVFDRGPKNPESIYNSLFSVVFETFNVLDYPFITEKSLKPFLTGQFPLALGSPGIMSYLCSLGFILPNYMNWTEWDSLPLIEWQYNKTEIFKKEFLSFFKENNLQKISEDYFPYAQHNYKRLLLFPKLIKEENTRICDWVMSIIKNPFKW